MSHRSIICIAASVIIGIACVATVSTDAFACRRGVGVARPGVRVVAPVHRGVAVGVGAAAVGAAAVHGARCGDYPHGPCY